MLSLDLHSIDRFICISFLELCCVIEAVKHQLIYCSFPLANKLIHM